ncbi:MAG: hypothetical protein NC431_08850, partial [Firmicutes bacterium]|nr:hypothetical protein [Bacillota bacterium]
TTETTVKIPETHATKVKKNRAFFSQNHALFTENHALFTETSGLSTAPCGDAGDRREFSKKRR